MCLIFIPISCPRSCGPLNKLLLGMQRYWEALCRYCASQHASRGLSHLPSVIKPINNIFSCYILYTYDVRQPVTYSFLGVFSPSPLMSFQHPAASSTRGQPVRMSSLQFPSNAPFPVLHAGCEEPVQHLLTHPRYLGFVAFSTGFCKSISLTVPRAAASQSH